MLRRWLRVWGREALVPLLIALSFLVLPAVACPDSIIPLDGKTVCPAGHWYEPLRLAGPRWVGLCYKAKGDVEAAVKRACATQLCDEVPGAGRLAQWAEAPAEGYTPCESYASPEECELRRIRWELEEMNLYRRLRYLRREP